MSGTEPDPVAAPVAEPVVDDPAGHAPLKGAWLARFPESAINFELADFLFFRVTPRDARFVAGFGRIHNLSAQALQMAAIRLENGSGTRERDENGSNAS